MTRTSVFTQPFLRGVGKRSNLGVENSVATYVDGVYLASPISALLDLRGIERVEVLNGRKGPVRAQRDGRRDPGRHAGPEPGDRRAKRSCTRAPTAIFAAMPI